MKNVLLPILAGAGVVAVSAASSDAEIAGAVQAAFTELEGLRQTSATQGQALTDATAKVEELEAAKADTDAKLAKLEQEAAATAAATLEQKANDVVNNAVKEGRIVAAAAPGFLAMAKSNLEQTTATLAMMPTRGTLSDASQVAAAAAASLEGTKVVPLAASSVMADINARTSPTTIGQAA